MITKNLLLVLLCFSITSNLISQETTVTITLTVDKDQLGNDRSAPGGCTFSVVPTNKVVINDPNDPKSFTIRIDPTDVVEWKGITTTGEDVKIKRIKYLSGTKIFSSDVVRGNMRNGKETVKAKPIRNTSNDKDFEYAIRFKVKDNSLFSYEIDPRIKVGNQ